MKPENIEYSIDRLFERVARTLSKSTEAGRILALGVLFYIMYFATPIFWTQNYPQWSRLYLVSDRYWLTIALVALSYFYRWLPKPWFNAAVLLIAWAASSALNGVTSLWICVYPLYYWAGFGLLKWLTRDRRLFTRWAASIIMLFGFCLCMYIAGVVGSTASARYFQISWTAHPEYAFLTFLYLAWTISAGGNHQAALMLSPSHLSNPLPIPISSNIESTHPEKIIILWWRGYLDLIFAILLTAICIALGNRELPEMTTIATAYQYVYFVIFITAAMNILTAFMRLYGIDASPASRYVALASSPLDVWRRGTTHVYNMVLQLIFVPTMRKTRSLFIASVSCLVFVATQMFFFHEIGVRSFYALIMPQFGDSSFYVVRTIKYTSTFACGWLALILIWHYTIERAKQHLQSSSGQWLKIVLNHLAIVLLMLIISRLGAALIGS